MGNAIRKHKKSLFQQSSPYYYINNRKFFKNEEVIWPNPIDDVEIDRLIMEHFVIRHSWKSKNFISPIERELKLGVNVVDIGCGSGTWVLEMASEYPYSTITGVDFSTLFPTEIKPVNSRFLEHNIKTGFPFESESIDFAHQRLVGCGILKQDWEQLIITEYARILKIGGWLEIFEGNTLINPGPNTKRLFDALLAYYESIGIDVKITQKLARYLANNDNFTNIQHQQQTIPIGTWAGRVGELTANNFLSLFDALSSWLLIPLNITLEEFKTLTQIFEKEVNDYHTHWQTERFIAQRCIK
ncbi:12885_t:CDS:2 [Ambispora leptoticha]|uniref:12885_t:CDS:1 n=1 Tax=Ambispora leptoticha TaxID=144679 RepID=A0A9N8W731_9GLOM|nr:12885_t:CDS:2 [Ambispora leptoticha]